METSIKNTYINFMNNKWKPYAVGGLTLAVSITMYALVAISDGHTAFIVMGNCTLAISSVILIHKIVKDWNIWKETFYSLRGRKARNSLNDPVNLQSL